MSAEKKKRIPKPEPNEATKFIMDVAFDFLSLPTNTDKKTLLEKAEKALGLIEYDPETICEWIAKYRNEWEADQTEKELREALEIGRKMIFVASGLSMKTEELEEIKKEVNKIYSEITFKVDWVLKMWFTVPHFAGAIDPETNQIVWMKSHVKGLKQTLVYWLIGSLNMNGQCFFRACPRCYTIFKKTRKDQIYCSDNCRDVQKMRNRRKRK